MSKIQGNARGLLQFPVKHLGRIGTSSQTLNQQYNKQISKELHEHVRSVLNSGRMLLQDNAPAQNKLKHYNT